MNFFSKIADGFVQAFGITAPTPENHRVTTIFICTLLGGVLLFFFFVAGFLILHILR
jgi:hypothetical protein